MTGPVCAYCKQPGTMTREHVWPASLHRRLLEANEQEGNLFWLARLKKVIESEPKIRDVCASCNNGVLSDLDAYICSLFDAHFVNIPARHEMVRFTFDYHLLKRWLLKLCYNSARIHTSLDLFAFETLLPYINGVDEKLSHSVQLFLQLDYPGEVLEKSLAPSATQGARSFFRPLSNRVGHMFFRAQGVGQKLLRAVHLRAFTFYLAFFNPSESCAVIDHFSNCFTHSLSGVALLAPSVGCVELECNGMDAWSAYEGSRDVQFISRTGR